MFNFYSDESGSISRCTLTLLLVAVLLVGLGCILYHLL